MSSRAGRARRAARGVVAASLATFVATVSHAAVTGEASALPNVALAFALAAPLCVMLTGRVLSWWRLSIAVVLSQVLFHSLLALDLTGTGPGAVPAAHHGGVIVSVGGVASAAPALLHGADSPWMWVAHAFAAVVTIVALGSGERAARTLAGLLADTFRALVPFRALRPASMPAPRPDAPLLTRGIAMLSVMRHRGPPLAA